MDQPQLYLLPCSCGKQLQVRARQAGEEVTCTCGAMVHVPTIRGLRQLETVVDDQAVAQPARSQLQGPTFAIGMLLLVIGAAVLGATFIWPPQELAISVQDAGLSEDDVKRSKIAVEDMGAADLYDEFLALRDRGRSAQTQYAKSLVDAAINSQRNRQLIGCVLAALGGLMTIVGLALPAFVANGPRAK